MRELGSERVLLKILSSNDNSKNQVYLGAGYDSLQMIPGGELHAEQGTSRRYGKEPSHIVKSALNFWWLADDTPEYAPDAQLILYPQYPEVRMSGFLKNTSRSPSEIMDSRVRDRVLFLGTTKDGEILAWVEAADSPVANEVRAGMEDGRIVQRTGVLWEIILESRTLSSRDELCARLLEIHRAGWIPSFRLNSSGERIAYKALNGAGYTLEGMFGITPNGVALPDFLDWELKACTTSRWPHLNESARITLMTPEPTTGLYVDNIECFRERYTSATGEGEAYFTGTRKIGQHKENDNLNMVMTGIEGGKITSPELAGIFLVDAQAGDVAAGWTAVALLEHWKQKHGHTAFVPCEKKDEDGAVCYRYSHIVRLGEGADFSLLLKAFAAGIVYHDPGVKFTRTQSGTWKLHKRNQFRANVSQLNRLYKRCEDVDVSGGGTCALVTYPL